MQRVEWFDEHVEEILASARNPLDDNSDVLWLKAEDPWQFLAGCFEARDALESGDPHSFISQLPVHTDGSCNGLQHYAALGRDADGGAKVNLLPAEQPQDVYMAVCNRARERMTKHAQDPSHEHHALAKLMLPHLGRKIVKQTVMTSVYGVTTRGAMLQVLRRLEELSDIDWPEPAEMTRKRAATYISKLSLQSLTDLFTSARAIMDWLRISARLIAHAEQPVVWLSPMGLPCVQPYRIDKFTTKDFSQITTLQVMEQNSRAPIMKTRQSTAFPPNFVHSLDATHMMMTALACRDAGLTFASVHDSFWTHACDMDQLAQLLREEFVKLYEQPVLEQLHEFFVAHYPEIRFPPLPAIGKLDLRKVLESPYFFS